MCTVALHIPSTFPLSQFHFRKRTKHATPPARTRDVVKYGMGESDWVFPKQGGSDETLLSSLALTQESASLSLLHYSATLVDGD